MNIGIIGTGYVGLVTGACMSDTGNSVICYDIDNSKISALNNGKVFIYEPGLKNLISKNMECGNIKFSSDFSRLCSDNEILFIAVGTPSKSDGSADLSNIFSVAETIGNNISSDITIVVKSTVPVGTTHLVSEKIASIIKERGISVECSVVNNPEFLREGRAVSDFMRPDRIIIGSDNKISFKVMRNLYRPFSINRSKIIEMDILSSEMTKYASNSMLACRISFMNEMSRICEILGADVNHVRNGMGADQRIGYQYLYPSIGFGGSCFPKDLRAMKNISESNGYTPMLVNATIEVNEQQKIHFCNRIIDFIEKNNTIKVSIWGLSFKPQTDDIRESPSIYIINQLISRGIRVSAYDPKAMENFENYMKNDNIEFGKDKYEILDNSDCLIMLTEWQEFKSPDFHKIKNQMNSPVIFDGRNIYNQEELEELDFKYFQIGVRGGEYSE